MTDYINREEAKKTTCGLCRWEGTSNCEECEHPIDDISAADVVERKVGEWEVRIVEDEGYDPFGFFKKRYYCSVCGHWQTHGKTKFCHNCGAEMKRGKK